MNLKFWKKRGRKQEIKQKTNYEFVEYYYNYRVNLFGDFIDIYCAYRDTVSGKMISKRIKTVRDTVEMRIELIDKLEIREFLDSKYNTYLQQLKKSKFDNTIKELKEAMEENKVYKEE